MVSCHLRFLRSAGHRIPPLSLSSPLRNSTLKSPDAATFQMSATPAPPPNLSLSSSSKNPHKFPASVSSFFFTTKNKSLIRCELKSFEHNSSKWTVDCVSGSDPIHIILKPPANPLAMGSIDSSSGRSSKKVCLFYCAEMKALAERIAAESDAIELRSISWR